MANFLDRSHVHANKISFAVGFISILILIGSSIKMIRYAKNSLQTIVNQHRNMQPSSKEQQIMCLQVSKRTVNIRELVTVSGYEPFTILSCLEDSKGELEDSLRMISREIAKSHSVDSIRYVPLGRYSVILGPDYFYNHDIVGNLNAERSFKSLRNKWINIMMLTYAGNRSGLHNILTIQNQGFGLPYEKRTIEDTVYSRNLRIIEVDRIGEGQGHIRDFNEAPRGMDQKNMYVVFERPSLQDRRISYFVNKVMRQDGDQSPEFKKKLEELFVYRWLTSRYEGMDNEVCLHKICAYPIKSWVR